MDTIDSPDAEAEPPAAKRAKTTTTHQQSSLTSFFSAPAAAASSNSGGKESTKPETVLPFHERERDTADTAASTKDQDDTVVSCFDPIHPVVVPHDTSTANARWGVYKDGEGSVLHRTTSTVLKTKTKSASVGLVKIAAFDLGGTLVTSIKQFPSALQDYELWNDHGLVSKLRDLHDNQGYQLVLFLNQGGIRGAITGKTATKIKNLIEWLAGKIIQRPIAAFVSCNKKGRFHKPAPDMWAVAQELMGQAFDTEASFFVGDSVDRVDDGDVAVTVTGDDQGLTGDDQGFARNLNIKFETPEQCFGPSNKERRLELRAAQKQMEYQAPSSDALQIRAALTSGYLTGPILLVLCGPQGAGKSYFCNQLMNSCQQQNNNWTHLSQDTISKGKSGSREQVERAANKALQEGKSVVVDRMHLDAAQRAHFVRVAQANNVPVHAVVLNTPKDVVAERVLYRENHTVQGERGAKMAQASWSSMTMPEYEEGFSLISASSTPEGSKTIVDLYRSVVSLSGELSSASLPASSFNCPSNVTVPSIALGTYKLGKRVAKDVVSTAAQLGFKAFDTAPTYNNEDFVGAAGIMAKDDVFCIAKVPKRATTTDQVHKEIDKSLDNLNTKCVGLLLLHWPGDVIAADTLKEVWGVMEECVKDGKARALGVCNFNIGALRMLLPVCSTTKPIVNQVERHPLLPQWDLVDFCAQHDILIQAHSPLGQASSVLLEHSVVQQVATRTGRSPAQVVLQWNLLQRVAVVPKCSSKEHMLDVLAAGTGDALSAEDTKALNEITETKRFVAPPFMYGNEAYHWGKKMPH